jgi:hypothetical protein
MPLVALTTMFVSPESPDPVGPRIRFGSAAARRLKHCKRPRRVRLSMSVLTMSGAYGRHPGLDHALWRQSRRQASAETSRAGGAAPAERAAREGPRPLALRETVWRHLSQPRGRLRASPEREPRCPRPCGGVPTARRPAAAPSQASRPRKPTALRHSQSTAAEPPASPLVPEPVVALCRRRHIFLAIS